MWTWSRRAYMVSWIAVGSIEIDHPGTLGNTEEKIAWQKAGLYKVSSYISSFARGTWPDVCLC